MPEPLSVAGVVLDLVKRAKEAFVGRNAKTWTLVVLVALVAAYCVYQLAEDPARKGTYTYIGGLDLSQYCSSYGYTKNSEDLCSSAIDLNKACSWQWSQPGLVARAASGPLSAKCYTSERQALGGINDMLGYCRAVFRGSAAVRASVAEGAWRCATLIQPDNACDWQYQKSGLVARKDNGLWGCFDRNDR